MDHANALAAPTAPDHCSLPRPRSRPRHTSNLRKRWLGMDDPGVDEALQARLVCMLDETANERDPLGS